MARKRTKSDGLRGKMKHLKKTGTTFSLLEIQTKNEMT